MVYLIGVNHGVQFLKNSYTSDQVDVVNKFGDFVRKNIDEFDIKVIAEEMDTEALAKHTAKSYTKKITQEKTIGHIFCNPTTEEKKKIGINNDTDREKEWFRRIQNYSGGNILFICGHRHLHSFKDLLKANGVQCQIISEEYWGKELDANEIMKKWLQQK